MFRFDRVEKYRAEHPARVPHKTGDPYGWFEIPSVPNGPIMYVLASSATEGSSDFNHVSVSMAHRPPTWSEMCKIKDLFWDQQDCVVQYHPPRSDYVNIAKTCLHLWEWTRGEFPRPSPIELGPLYVG